MGQLPAMSKAQLSFRRRGSTAEETTPVRRCWRWCWCCWCCVLLMPPLLLLPLILLLTALLLGRRCCCCCGYFYLHRCRRSSLLHTFPNFYRTLRLMNVHHDRAVRSKRFGIAIALVHTIHGVVFALAGSQRLSCCTAYGYSIRSAAL